VNFDSEILQLIREWHSCKICGKTQGEDMGKSLEMDGSWMAQWEIHL